MFLLSHFILIWSFISYVFLPTLTGKKHRSDPSGVALARPIKIYSVRALATFALSFFIKWPDALEVIAMAAALGVFVGAMALSKDFYSDTLDKSLKRYVFAVWFPGFSYVLLQRNILTENKLFIDFVFLLALNACGLLTIKKQGER